MKYGTDAYKRYLKFCSFDYKKDSWRITKIHWKWTSSEVLHMLEWCDHTKRLKPLQGGITLLDYVI